MTTEIQTHDFEKAKNQIQKFANARLNKIELEAIPTAGGFLGLGSHKATGEEVNERLVAILSYIVTLNNSNNDLIKEFGEVYNALEALDKDYIQAILLSIKASEMNSEAIKKQQENLQCIVRTQSQLLRNLTEFKGKCEEYGYLSQIDDFLATYKKKYKTSSDGSLNSVQSQVADISNFISDKVKVIDELSSYIDHLKLISHLEDVDMLWGKASELTDALSNITSGINSIKDKIENQIQKCIELKTELDKTISKTAELEKANDEHQNDIYRINLMLSEHSDFNENTRKKILAILENNEKLKTSINAEKANRKREIKDLSSSTLSCFAKIHKQFIVAYVVESIALVLAGVALFILV